MKNLLFPLVILTGLLTASVGDCQVVINNRYYTPTPYMVNPYYYNMYFNWQPVPQYYTHPIYRPAVPYYNIYNSYNNYNYYNPNIYRPQIYVPQYRR